MSRRRFLTVTATATLLTACGPTRPGTVARDGSITVEHIFGATRIPGPPHRVVSAGLTEQDDLLAVGVVPIAVTDWFGGEPFAVWPWAQPRLGTAQPAVLDLTDGVPVDEIAALHPDLIVAANAGLDADTYHRLSQIAPTVAQSGPDAFFEPWRQQSTRIGQAVFAADEMAALIAGVDEAFDSAGAAHPQFAGKSVLLLSGRFHRDRVEATPPGWRTDFLTRLGFTVVDTAAIGREQVAEVLDPVDVLIWTTESDDEQAALEADPVISGQRNVFTGKELAGAIAFASPLSYPVVAERLPPLLAAALA
ncbi:ABC transporter substrate-binding protein [Mycolicibacterium thermoresistibile]